MIGLLAVAALAGPTAEPGPWRVLGVLGDDTSAVVAHADALRDLAVAATARVAADEASLDLLRSMREETMELDLGRLYALLPEALPTDARRIGVRGWWDAPAWHLEVGAAGPPPVSDLGSVHGALVMRPVPSPVEGAGRAWGADLDLDVVLGPLDHATVAALWEAGLVEAEQIARGGAARSSRLQPGLVDDEDVRLWSALAVAAPTFTERLSSAVVVERIGRLRPEGLELDAQMRVDPAALQDAGYRDLGRYLKRLDRVFELDVRLVDPDGRRVATAWAATADLSMGMRMLAADGAVVPIGSDGPVPGGALRPTDPAVDLAMRLSMVVRSDGMEVGIDDYALPITWRCGPDGTRLALDVTDVPDVDLRGSSAMTGWIAEIADGLFDLEGHAQVVFAAVAHGPDGRGTTVRLDHDRHGGVHASARAVAIDNGLVRFFMRLAGRSLVPSDAVVADAYAAAAALVDGLDADWRPVRARWLASQDLRDDRPSPVVEPSPGGTP